VYKEQLGEPKDWNAEFQRCVDMPQNTPEEKLKRWIQIAKVAQDFEHTGKEIVKDFLNQTNSFILISYNSFHSLMKL
jgi:hypothetical protein